MYKRLPQYSLVFLVSIFLTLFAQEFGLLAKIENITYDWRVQALSSTKSPMNDIALVLVDQPSLEWMEREQGIGWPWPRELYGAIVSFAKEGGAKAVVVDMMFSEDSVYNKTDDIAFGESLKLLPTIGAIALADDKIIFPVKEIAASFSSLGAANAISDSDGVIRRARLSHLSGSKEIPSLALASYQNLYPDNKRDFDNIFFINYFDAPFSYKSYSGASVIQSWIALQEGTQTTLNPDVFKDKVVFMGMSALGLFDQRVSPLSKNHPGVDIQATILDNLVNDSFIRPVPFTHTLLYMTFFSLIATWLMARAKKATHFLIPIIVIPSIISALGYLYYFYDFWLNVTTLFTATFFVILFSGMVGYLLEGRQKRYLKTAFSHYVSPTIVDKLIDSPERLKLGGESKELSIFFSDIEGFTSISEKLEPELLITMLHEYLDNLSGVIINNGGTIDKYEGDAIIAFWNAPLDTQDHETLAVQSALECQTKLAELNPIFQEKYGVQLKTRMGIHTGKVIVGNLGSAKRFDYSFIGDAGNLAARLEGVNKVFNSGILLSKTTFERVKGIDFRKIGTIRVVGRKEPVEVYQPLSERLDFEETFFKALTLFESTKFEEAKKIFSTISEVDDVSKRYLKIIDEIEAGTTRWEGAIVLTGK